MSKRSLALLLAAVFLAGCDHHHAASPHAPVERGDSALTGEPPQPIDSMKTYPRATLVALPPARPRTVVTSAAGASTHTPDPAPLDTTTPNASESLASTAPVSTPLTTPTPIPNEESTPAVSPVSTTAPSSDAPADNFSSSMAPDAPDIPRLTSTESLPSVLPSTTPVPNDNQVVAIRTSEGEIIIELDDFAAPKTCKNFRQLIADGFYNNTVFHRVIPGFIIQGGDPKSKSSASDRDTYGLGSPGYTLPAEISLKHDRGAVAMARLPDEVNPNRESNGSQFYICLAACPTLDDQYTVFGHVIKGLDVAAKIGNEARDRRDNPLKRIEMTMILEPKEEALGSSSVANP